jgi:hypothetical protein
LISCHLNRRSLTQGAVIVLRELLARFPDENNAEALERWRVSAAAFAALLRRLDLDRELIRDHTCRRLCARFLKAVWARVEPEVEQMDDNSAVSALLCVMARQTIHWPWHYWDGSSADYSMLEPFDELSRLPIPKPLAEAIGAGDIKRASVSTLLSCALGDPSAIARSPEIAAVLLLAACRIVAVDGAPFVTRSGHPREHKGWDDLTLDFRQQEMFQAVSAWLIDNLPRLAFEKALEQMIASASKRTDHRTDPTGGAAPEGGGPGGGRHQAVAEDGFDGRDQSQEYAGWLQQAEAADTQAKAEPRTILISRSAG